MAYNLLKGKKGIIFGALDEKSIAWRTALRCHEEGAQLVLSNAPVALRMGEINKLAEATGAPCPDPGGSRPPGPTSAYAHTPGSREGARSRILTR